MKTNYRYWYIRRQDDVHISECAIRFYEGDDVTEDITDVQGNINSVTHYKIQKRLQKADMPHFTDKVIKKDLRGNETIVYTDTDFGVIETNEELDTFLKKELKKDTIRIPVPWQEDNDQQ